MNKIISAHPTSKYQVTIPKEVRQILGIDNPDDPLGFVIDTGTHSVKLTRIEIIPSGEDCTDEEYKKLLRICDKHEGKICKTAEEALTFHKKLTQK